MGIDQPGGGETLVPIEAERKPHYRFMVMRHAERNIDGTLRPEGVANAQAVGETLSENSEVVKGYVSDEPSKRTFLTSDLISESSGIKSPLTGEKYATKEVSGLTYEILKPDLFGELERGRRVVDEVTIKELGLPADADLKKLPKEEQARVSPVRQKNEPFGAQYVLSQQPVVHRLAMGLANQLVHEINIAQRYQRRRTPSPERPDVNLIQKDAVLNTVTHLLLSESLFLEAAVRRTQEGQLDKINNMEELGGTIRPTEAYYLDVEDPSNLPEYIPVVFQGKGRPLAGSIFMEKAKLLNLAEEYKKWIIQKNAEDQK